MVTEEWENGPGVGQHNVVTWFLLFFFFIFLFFYFPFWPPYQTQASATPLLTRNQQIRLQYFWKMAVNSKQTLSDTLSFSNSHSYHSTNSLIILFDYHKDFIDKLLSPSKQLL